MPTTTGTWRARSVVGHRARVRRLSDRWPRRPDERRRTDRAATQPCAHLIERALRLAPLLIRVPQRDPAAARVTELFDAHPDQPDRRSPEFEPVVDRGRLLEDPPSDIGRLGEGAGTGDRPEV